jgi:hypothetical protein
VAQSFIGLTGIKKKATWILIKGRLTPHEKQRTFFPKWDQKLCSNTKRSVCLLGNIQALRSFLISQEISNVREEAMALRFGITPFIITLHQFLIVRPVH